MKIKEQRKKKKYSRRNAKRKTLQIDGAEKYTSARHARHAFLSTLLL